MTIVVFSRQMLNNIGHVMGMETIAEFVENDQILAKLRTIGVNYAQGYGVGKPRPLAELMAYCPWVGLEQH